MKLYTQGLSLIELVLSLFIASLITLLLYQSLNQSRTMVQQGEMVLHVASALPRAYNQLEKDITAVFVPERFFKEQAATEKEKPKEPLKDIFVATTKDKMASTVTFFSTHSLPSFNGRTPYAVRVVYRLVADQNNSYTLMRQESSDINMPLGDYIQEKVRAYPLLQGIRECTIEYSAYSVPSKKSDEKQEKKPEPEETTVLTWGVEEGKQKKELIVPAFIRIKGTVVDENARREYPFEWVFQVPVFDSVVQRMTAIEKQKSEKKEKEVQNQEPEKKQQPNNPRGGSRR